MIKRKRRTPAEEGGASWLTTFSDLMSLLLTFFILLYSMSNVDTGKYLEAANSLSTSLTGGGNSILEGVFVPEETKGTGAELDAELVEMYEKVANFLKENHLEEEATVNVNEKGVYVNMQSSILFDPQSAKISAEGKEALTSLAELLNGLDNDILVEGYTDNLPNLIAEYPSNWELSTDRAVAVLRYLSEIKGVAPSRMSAVGYGEYHPIAPNDTEANRAKNRRVNIVLVYDKEE